MTDESDNIRRRGTLGGEMFRAGFLAAAKYDWNYAADGKEEQILAHEWKDYQRLKSQDEPAAWMYKSAFGTEVCRFRWGTDEGLTSDHWIGWTEIPLYPGDPA